NNEIILVTLLLAFQKLFENIKYFYHGIFTRNQNLNKVAKAQNYSYFISFLIFIVAYFLLNNLVLSLALYVLTFIGSIFIETTLMKSVEKFKFQRVSIVNISNIFLTSLPLSFSSF